MTLPIHTRDQLVRTAPKVKPSGGGAEESQHHQAEVCDNVLKAQAHEARDDRNDDEELRNDVLGKDSTDDGHVDHEVGEHTLNQQACRVLLQLAHGQGGNEVSRVYMAQLRDMPLPLRREPHRRG